MIHNLITSRAVPELVAERGARAVRTRVGHSFIKAQMAEHDAVFGGEHSAHYYFRDFWFADTGMLAAMHVLAALGEQPGPLSQLAVRLRALRRLGRAEQHGRGRRRSAPRWSRQAFAADGVVEDRLDGLTLTCDGPDGRLLLVAEPAGQQHRTAAAAERRGRRPRHDGAGS